MGPYEMNGDPAPETCPCCGQPIDDITLGRDFIPRPIGVTDPGNMPSTHEYQSGKFTSDDMTDMTDYRIQPQITSADEPFFATFH
jgi:hypothetical protein